MGNIAAHRAVLSDARFLTSLEANFGVEPPRNWEEVIGTTSQTSEVWVATKGGLYAGFMVVAREAQIAYPVEVFVSGLCENDPVAETLIGTAALILAEKEGISWKPEAPAPFPSDITVPLPA